MSKLYSVYLYKYNMYEDNLLVYDIHFKLADEKVVYVLIT